MNLLRPTYVLASLALLAANAAWAQAAPTFQIFMLDLATHGLSQVTHTADGYSAYNPGFSPGGRQIVHDVQWAAPTGWTQQLAITNLRTGRTTPLAGGIVQSDNGKWSREEDLIAYTVNDGAAHIQVTEVEHGRTIFNLPDAQSPNWDPEGERLVYQAVVDNALHVTTLKGADRSYASVGAYGCFPVWSPKGNYIAYLSDCSGLSGFSLMILPVTEHGTPRGAPFALISPGNFMMGPPTISADGLTIAFSAAVPGVWEWGIYQVSVFGGAPSVLFDRPGIPEYDPAYSFDGKSLAFSSLP
jgi:Tol biopolymer transport system component